MRKPNPGTNRLRELLLEAELEAGAARRKSRIKNRSWNWIRTWTRRVLVAGTARSRMRSLLKIVFPDRLVLLVAPASVFQLKNVEGSPNSPG